ncbi:MAG: oligosaccharide flippase family protein [Nanoarchaeota archaeon]|nr:oligosaccharide flippase family protein [Nanoarchaeota archaeon]
MIQRIKSLIIKFLIKFQRFTGSDNVYLAKHGSYLVIGNIVSMTAAFLLSIALARLLPKETYGQYRYILSIMAILAIFSLEGINKAVIQGVAKGFEGVFLTGFKTKLKWSLLGALASIGVAFYFWLQGNIEFTVSFLIVAVFLPLFKGGEIYQSYLDGKKLFGRRINYVTLIQVLATISIIIALFLTKNLIILILVYFLSYSALRIFFLFLTIKKIKPNQVKDAETIRYGKHLSFMGIIGLIVQQIDSVLLFYFVGPIQLAIYSFATLPIQYIRTPLQIIQELALPKLSTRPEQDIKKTLPKKLLKITVLILLGIAIYVIVAPYFYKIFYPQYMESVFYSRLFALTLLVFPVSMMMLALQAKMKTKQLYRVSILSSIIEMVLMVLLTSFYGIIGAILARLISQFFYFFLARFSFKKM